MQLNLTRHQAAAAQIAPGMRIELQFGHERYYALTTRTFADARAGELILYEDSYGRLALAITGGDAARMTNAKAGNEVLIAAAPE
jgi:S-adenosylmethionine hydrolase